MRRGQRALEFQQDLGGKSAHTVIVEAFRNAGRFVAPLALDLLALTFQVTGILGLHFHLRRHLGVVYGRAEFGDAYLRIYLNEALRPGLADEVREMLPNAVEVKIETPATLDSSWMNRQGMQPRDLLASYFEQANVRDEAALKLFDDLVEEDHATAST